MNKQEFLVQLHSGLSGLPQDDVEERLTFYGEAIEDRIEEGLSEEEAVAAVGSVQEITAQVIAEIPLTKIARKRMQLKRQLKAWEIVLLALGSPIWLSLGIAAVAVVFSLYISLWSVVVALWAAFGALVGCSLGGVAAGGVFAFNGNTPSGIAMLAAGFVCAGLSVYVFYGCREATKGILLLTKKLAAWIKNCFIKKEEA